MVSIQVAQPVAQMWAKTLAALQAFYPLVGLAFLVLLLSVVHAVFSGVTDAELAGAVQFAGRLRSRVQRSEGLFLSTVPGAIAYLRQRGGAGGDQARDVSRSSGDTTGSLAAAAVADLSARGPRFAPLLAIAADLAEQVRAGTVTDNAWESSAVDALYLAREAMAQVARPLLDPEERVKLGQLLKDHVRDLQGKKENGRGMITAQQIAQRVRVVETREIFGLLGLPQDLLLS